MPAASSPSPPTPSGHFDLTSPEAVSTRRAIAVFYFAWLGALGLFAPYFGLYLRALGLSEGAAARLQGVVPAVGLLTPPLVGLLADAQRARPHLLRVTSGLAALAFALLLVVPARWGPIAATVALFALVRSPVPALIDAAAADSVIGGMGFGRLRLWGSVGFLVTVSLGGALFDRVGIGAMRIATVIALFVGAATAWRVPAPRIERHPEALEAWLALAKDGVFLRFLVAMAATQAAASSYDACFSLHLQRLGASSRTTGIAWGVGVLAEIALLAWQPQWLRRIRPERLFAASIAVAALRWLALSQVTSVPVVIALQPLHGITFGLWYVSAVAVCRAHGRHIPTASQGMLAAAGYAGSALGMSVAGELLASGGGALLYGVASVVALGGAAVAWSFARRGP